MNSAVDEAAEDGETVSPIGWPLVLFGLGLWLLVGLDVYLDARHRHELHLDVAGSLFVAAFVAFGVAHVLALRLAGRAPRAAILVLVVAQAAFTLLDLDLTVLLLLEIPLVLGSRLGRRLGVALVALTAARVAYELGTNPSAMPEHRRAISVAYGAGVEVVRIGLIQAAALVGGLALAHERAARQALGRMNAELARTRAALAERERAEERARIGLELHDHLGHNLAALSLQLDLARVRPEDSSAVAVARELVGKMLGDVRSLLRAEQAGLHEKPLHEALEELLAPMPGIRSSVEVDESACELPPDIARAMIGIAQEAITNAVRHGRANAIHIVVRAGDATTLSVIDDGVGVLANGEGRGIPGMRARAERVGGRVAVEPVPGRGTTVRFEVP